MDGLGKNMRQTPVLLSQMDNGSNLKFIHIMNIKISNVGWTAFVKGLEAQYCRLETLKLNLVEFDREGFYILAEGLKKNLSVAILDLSYNNLKDSYGDLLSNVISA